MNKKFSTLLASVLLTSAFSVNAANPVEGDYVRLGVGTGDNVVGIVDGALHPETVRAELEAGNAASTETAYKAYFKEANTQLWKIAKITKAATTGAETYQFINKQTGEYLAIKLVTDRKDHTSESAAKLDPAGNKDWAFDGDKLYFYDAVQDSTFYLDGGLKLVSKPGKDVAGATKIKRVDISEDVIELDANAFNVLMGLNGNDGKLHFNGKKDVSEKETNILKDTKWTAVQFAAGSKGFALTNGKTVEGYTNGLADNGKTGSEREYYKIDKKQFLQVDTTFFDDAKAYHKLVVDTVGYEPYAAVSGKYEAGTFADDGKAKKRASGAAELSGKYYIANDSIVLKAEKVPDLAKVDGLTPSVFVANPDVNLTALYNTALAVVAPDEANKTALNNLLEAVDVFTTEFVVGSSEQRKFSTASITIEGVQGAKTGANWLAALTADSEVAERLKGMFADTELYFDAVTLENGKLASDDANLTAIDGLLSGTLSTQVASGNAKKVADAYASFKTFATGTGNNSETHVATFSGDYFANDNQGYQGETAASGTKGSDLIAGVDPQTWTEEEQAAWAQLVEKLNALQVAVAVYPMLTENELTAPDELDVETYSVRLLAELNGDAELKSKLEAVKAAVDEFIDPEETQNTDSTKKLKFYKDDNKTLVDAVVSEETGITDYINKVKLLEINEARVTPNAVDLKIYYNNADVNTENANKGQIVLRKLSSATILTITNDGDVSEAAPRGYILPLVQPYATTGGDAKIATTNFHFIKVKNEGKVNAPILRAADEAAIETNKYWIVDWKTGTTTIASTEVSEADPYTQWAFVEGSTGSYSIINRATEKVMYTGPLFKVADAENTFTNGVDTLQLSAVEIPESAVITEGDKKYDVSGAFYPGKDETLIKRLFAISPVSPFMSQLNAQFNKDSVMILGNAEDAPVWQLAEVSKSKKTYGYTIEGIAPLLKAEYNIYTKDGDDNVYYVVLKNGKYVVTKSTSKEGNKPTAFTFLAVAENQYVIKNETANGYDAMKMTINPTPAKPILEASDPTSERNDLFTFTQVNQNLYRTLTDEDGVLGNAKIYMENEPNRFLYENTANIVANNGTGYNFLGIYNTAELTKNAALYVDTAYVNRENNLMPQYMFALGVETVDAKDAVACTYEHNHFDNAGNKVDALHCSHATPATLGYKSGRYLVALNDSTPENGSMNHPTYYDNAVRLAFVPAIHRNAEDSLIIKDSKWTDNSKQIKAGEAKTYASKDTMKIADQALNPATFALLIKDQATKSFYLQNGNGYVRILNGVPVLTASTKDAAVFNIAATEEEATANEAIEASQVTVIGGQGVVTVQGAAGKVITVANILGQTIANQVAASDNVTIAAPAGVVVVAVDGDATKVVVK